LKSEFERVEIDDLHNDIVSPFIRLLDIFVISAISLAKCGVQAILFSKTPVLQYIFFLGIHCFGARDISCILLVFDNATHLKSYIV
jgi:hypothetical protein